MCGQVAFQNEILGPAACSTVSEMRMSTKGLVQRWCRGVMMRREPQLLELGESVACGGLSLFTPQGSCAKSHLLQSAVR